MSPNDTVVISIIDKNYINITTPDPKNVSKKVTDKYKRNKFSVKNDPNCSIMTITTDGMTLSFKRQSDASTYEVLKECFTGQGNEFDSYITLPTTIVPMKEMKSVANMRRPSSDPMPSVQPNPSKTP